MKRVSGLLLAAVMALELVAQPIQAGAAGTRTPQEYEIYPIPHSIVYEEGDYTLKKQVNVVYEDGVDEATKARVREIAALKDLTLVERPAQPGGTNLLVGIAGDGDNTVDSYMRDQQLIDAAALEKSDSYLLSSRDGTIAILGRDADASFYGATTLYHIVNQLEDKTIRSFQVKDYADVVSRGFIEGYYGNPWSTQDRVELMKWGGYYKLNSYFYAPKDDPKHNAKWRELYTQEELETRIKPLAEAGNSSKCRFVFALHTYMYDPIRYDTEEHYQADMAVVKAKFAQVIEAGVRQIAILADDAGLQRPEDYKRTLEDMTQWLREQQQTYPDLKLNLPFCVQEYYYGVDSLPGYYTTFPENVQLMVTGGAIWGDVYKGFNEPFTRKYGRGPYLWVNWPCSDNSKDNLVMGGYQVLHTDVEPGTVQGIVLNPMQQSEPSKVGIFGNACYAWNIWNEAERDQAYRDSFKYVDHNSAEETPASEALRELSKHMCNHKAGGSYRHEESLELAPKLTAFKSKLGSSLTAEDVDSVMGEFAKLQKAAETFRAQGSRALLGDIGKDYTAPEANEQMAPWIDTWDDVTEAAIRYLNAVKLTLREDWDVNKVLDAYNGAQESMARAESHEFFYVNHMEHAVVGRQHIMPFLDYVSRWLAQQLLVRLDPTVQIQTYITNVPGFERPDEGKLEDMFDDDDATAATFKGHLYLKKGDYMGVTYSNPITLNSVRIVMGTPKDHFQHSRVEYTTDGEHWKPVNDQIYDRPTSNDNPPIVIEELNIPDVKGVRLIAAADNNVDTWTKVHTFSINSQRAEDPGAPVSYPVSAGGVSIENAVIAGGDVGKLVDGSKTTELWLKRSAEGENRDSIPAGAAVVLDLGAAKPVGSVCFDQDTARANGGDIISKGVVEYKTEGGQWTVLGELTAKNEQTVTADDPVQARYIRVRNTQDKGIWWRLSEVTVYGPAPTGGPDRYLFTNVEKPGIRTKVTEAAAELTAGTVTLEPGQYVGLDLGEIRGVNRITLPANLNGAKFQVSANNVVWTGEQGGAVDLRVRYLRFINDTEKTIVLTIDRFRMENLVVGQLGQLLSDDIADWGWGDTAGNGAAFDGDVSTTTKFGGNPMKGNTAVYSLGRAMDIDSIRVYNADTEYDYVRDCEIQLSRDGKTWKTALVIGDGAVDTDRTTAFGSISDPAKRTDSNHPNKFYYGNDKVPADVGAGARFLRVLITADYPERALVLNEIMLNRGGYISPETDLAFQGTTEAPGHLPSYMLDKDLNTTYLPGAANGSMTYTLSDDAPVGGLRLVQIGAVSNAAVTAEVFRNGGLETLELGRLSQSVNDFVIPADARLLAVTLRWTDKLPALSELILLDKLEQPEKPDPDPEPEPEKPSFPDVKEGQWFYKGVMYSAEHGIINGLPDGTFGPDVKMSRAQLVQMLYAMAGRPTVKITDKFSDVSEGQWFAAAASWAVEAGVTSGVGGGLFAPNKEITRQEIAVMLHAFMKKAAADTELTFADNAEIAPWAVPSVKWAVENGLMKGVLGNKFAPKALATRAEAATIMMNLDKMEK